MRPTGPKVALCVGVAKYTSAPLINTVNDARDVAAALQRVGYHTTTLLDEAATKKGMRQAVEQFASRLGKGGVAFFFFAGHGMSGLDGKNYLVPVNMGEYIEDLEDEAVSLEWVNSRLQDSGCMLHVVVADACRVMPNVRSRTRAIPQAGFQVSSAAPAEVGSLLSYSCDIGKVSWDGNRFGRNSAYTNALLRHLTTPDLHVETVFTRTARDCQELTRNMTYNGKSAMQRPWKSANVTYEHVCLF